MSNKSVKEKLIKIYGEECFIEKLHLRKDTEPRKYKSKGQYKRMKKLSYHHILEKSKGGKATVENGALLSVENHQWFHKQPIEEQRRMNEIFKEYKECKIVPVDNLETGYYVNCIEMKVKNREYNRAKEKEELRKMIDDLEERE